MCQSKKTYTQVCVYLFLHYATKYCATKYYESEYNENYFNLNILLMQLNVFKAVFEN